MAHQIFDVIHRQPASASMDSSYVANTLVQMSDNQIVDSLQEFLWVSNSDTIAHTVRVVDASISPAGIIGSASIPAGAGHGATNAVDLVALLLGATNNGIPLPGSFHIAVAVGEAIAAGTVGFYGIRGFF